MERTGVISKLKKLIEEERGIKIASNDQKLDIDSFAMTLIITYVGEEIGIQLDMDKLDFDAFTSLNTLADLVFSEKAN